MNTTNSTKRAMIVLIGSLLLLPCFQHVSADYVPGSGIMNTPHDFSTDGHNAVTVGACTFCHTPHKSYQTRLLWNHSHPPTDYTWGNYTVTNGGTPLPTIQSGWEGPTVLCLSCHDGTVARGDIAWFEEKSWTGADAINKDKVTIGSVSDPFSVQGFMEGMINKNHPVAAPYPYLQVRNTYNGVTTGTSVSLSKYVSDPTASGIRLFSNPCSRSCRARRKAPNHDRKLKRNRNNREVYTISRPRLNAHLRCYVIDFKCESDFGDTHYADPHRFGAAGIGCNDRRTLRADQQPKFARDDQ